MLQIGNKPIDTMYVGGKLVQQAYIGNKKVYPLHGVIPKAIKDSLVCWYDIGKQQCTNESMAANPVLADLSGNGHDIECFNFGWSGMSGIGGYIFQPLDQWHKAHSNNGTYTVEGYTLHITKLNTAGIAFYVSNLLGKNYVESIEGKTVTTKSFRIRINGLPDGKEVTIDGILPLAAGSEHVNILFPKQYFNSNGEHIVASVQATVESENDVWSGNVVHYPRILIESDTADDVDITIELLPEYPNALVSDGVDDYAQVTGLPLLTKERGYTVIAKRKLFYKENTLQALASKGAFILERQEINLSISNTYNFGSANTVTYPQEITYQTSKSFNGTNLSAGDSIDTDTLKIFVHTDDYTSIALYSFLLFDRDLTEQEIEWVKKNMIEGNGDDADWYGVEFYTTSDNPDCVRIGNPELHKTLPVHSQMKGCLLSDDGTVNKYLNETGWAGETLDGSQGQVMVEMPKESYWRFETDGNIRRVKFSTKPLPGFKKTPQGYVSAYEASVQRSASKLASVVNTTTDYRGGNNNAEWDGTYRSMMGHAATLISRTKFRNYARNRKADSTEWNCMTYDMQKLLYWLFVVEYGTLNSQKAFNADKDANGYAQGGLGNGVTNINNAKWNALNGYYPLIKCGYTNSLGNGTGQIPYTMPFEYEANGAANYAGEYDAEAAYTDEQFVSQGEELYECIADAAAGTALADTIYFKKVARTVTYVPRYRGVENPFGHLWQWTDGINVRISPTTENGGDNLSKVFVCSDPAQFKDNGYEGYTYVGNEARTEQYVKEVIFGEGGEIMPKVVGDGASSTKYFCDYHYTNIPGTETLRAVQFGGLATYGANAGFACAYSSSSPSAARSNIGSRLCFIHNNND